MKTLSVEKLGEQVWHILSVLLTAAIIGLFSYVRTTEINIMKLKSKQDIMEQRLENTYSVKEAALQFKILQVEMKHITSNLNDLKLEIETLKNYKNGK